ncbi:hypothetical protein V6N13_025498 [Hibiscus sabdariffa]|uniref:Uncharacterized protein n=1 Tax=Hibiscus sabdariffa TaxID=183260 RepID=A0ABR2P8K0_9ROSI
MEVTSSTHGTHSILFTARPSEHWARSVPGSTRCGLASMGRVTSTKLAFWVRPVGPVNCWNYRHAEPGRRLTPNPSCRDLAVLMPSSSTDHSSCSGAPLQPPSPPLCSPQRPLSARTGYPQEPFVFTAFG